MSDTGAPTPPTPPALPGPPPSWVAGRGVPVPREPGRLAQVLVAVLGGATTTDRREHPGPVRRGRACVGAVLLVGHQPGLGAALIGLLVWAAAAPAWSVAAT